MDERAAEIVRDLENERQNLGDNLAELETRVRDATDWRTYYERKPWAILGAAVGAGYLLSRIIF